MKLVVVTQWVRTLWCKSHRTKASPAGQEQIHVHTQQWAYAAGGSEEAGRVMEPRNE